MARKSPKKQAKRQKEEAMVQVDAFLIPAPQVEMYQTLREAVASEAIEYWQAKYPIVNRITDDPEEGEAIQVKDQTGQELFRFYLNPFNMSQAQKARDRDQLDKFLIKFEEVID
ncbi:hypothetical protein HZY91_05200 [Facklamia sp. DSM 111018]|uniref:Terminase small subunit n=1 Tax=Facklamia lactis TaxID=2749967 RepID=A0ABS0LQD7_9LACT|nr:hypothetical protein [Facklamia lactis]MBG9980496.1 hypothetical protein [Facklamia lactis]MBG9986288.1 hypothetical protein [Facklamia lactis]